MRRTFIVRAKAGVEEATIAKQAKTIHDFGARFADHFMDMVMVSLWPRRLPACLRHAWRPPSEARAGPERCTFTEVFAKAKRRWLAATSGTNNASSRK